MENPEDFKGGGSSIANLRNTQQHPAQHKQQMQQQPPQGQQIPQQQQQQPSPQQMQQMQQQQMRQQQQQQIQQQPTRSGSSVNRKETFMDTIKNLQWVDIGKSFGITVLLFFVFTNPELVKKIFKSLVPFDKQTKNMNRAIFAILVVITSFVVTIINKFALHI